MGRQLGFGFGKGRRVIKTIICGDALQAALARQQRWFEQHAVEDAAPLRMAKAALRAGPPITTPASSSDRDREEP